MKIRTDFVTNSSSISSAEIIIDNPVLLEILLKYKDLGTFGDKKPFFGIGEYFSYDENFDTSEDEYEPIEPAFYYYENLGGSGWPLGMGCPKTLGEVLAKIMAIIDDGYDDRLVKFTKELMDQMKAELIQRTDEIMNNYAEVFWRRVDDQTDNGDYEETEIFEFDPVKGEQYLLTREGGEDDE